MNPSHSFKLRTTLIAGVVASVLSPVQADSLNTITVTANRMPTGDVLAASTIITRDQIDQWQINDLPTLLTRAPGVDVTMTGGLGQQSSIFMRGTNSGHVLILVDGVKWYSATTGSAAIQDFPVSHIERIEIIRGPRSGLYGAEAIGGVINIITRQGSDEIKPYAESGYGSHDTRKASIGVNGSHGSTRFNLGVSVLESNGIDALKTADPDKDGYRNKSVSANLSHQFTAQWQGGVRFLRAEARNYFDEAFSPGANPFNNNTQQIIGADTSYALTERWTVNFDIAESRDRSETFENRAAVRELNTRHRQFSLINTFALADTQRLNIGFDYAHDKVTGSTDYDEDSRDNKAIFVSWQGSHQRHGWLLSLRHDDNEAFGEHTTGTAEWGYSLTESLQFVSSYGTAFKAPTFNDLYFPGFSNPDLNPEKSRSIAFGFRGTHDFAQWSVDLYETTIRDLIVFQAIPENVSRARIRGIEFDIRGDVKDWYWSLNASYIEPQDRDDRKRLIRRARQLMNATLDRQFGDWSAGASWHVRGNSNDRFFNTDTFTTDDVRLAGHGLVDLRFAYQISPEWTARLTAHNVFDKKYERVKNYNSLDRTVMFTVQYQP
ncbi:MAG: TonB-dependent receptor [Methylophaga sp.]|nr:TonB-dependent receptor [Methylophaga sp.]